MAAAVSCQFKIARYPFPSRRPEAPEPQCCSVLRLVPQKPPLSGRQKQAKLGKVLGRQRQRANPGQAKSAQGLPCLESLFLPSNRRGRASGSTVQPCGSAAFVVAYLMKRSDSASGVPGTCPGGHVGARVSERPFAFTFARSPLRRSRAPPDQMYISFLLQTRTHTLTRT